jgi:arsenate reductase
MAREILRGRAVVESAGSEPSGKVQPWAIEVLREEGIDISKHWSKSTDQLPKGFLDQLDYVITLCAEEVCPTLPSQAKRLHWPIPDPASASEDGKPEAFRSARESIREKLQGFLMSLPG